MITLKHDFAAYFDVDQTLIDWKSGMSDITITHNGITMQGLVMSKHVNAIKMHKFWGNSVVVWSKSGWSFAETVVKALELEDYVDVVCAKPSFVYDDKEFHQFMGELRYLYPDDRK